MPCSVFSQRTAARECPRIARQLLANQLARSEQFLFPDEDAVTITYATNGLPVAVIGGGPVGLAAAAHLLSRGLPVKLYEAGNTVATNVLGWSHVRLFSPWRFNIDEAARSVLREQGWREPPSEDLPTGRELYDAYLAPLAVALM